MYVLKKYSDTDSCDHLPNYPTSYPLGASILPSKYAYICNVY